MNECLNEYSLSLIEVIAMLSLAFTVGGTVVALWVYFRKKKSRKRKLERRVEENVIDIDINHRSSLEAIGALTSDQELTASMVISIANDMSHMISLRDRYAGTYKLMNEIRDDAKELKLDI